MYDFVTIGGTTRDVSFFTDQGVMLDNRRDILRQELLAFELGAKIKVDKFHYSYGGGAANAAVCLANFGFKTACLAPVGDDESGRLIIKNLAVRQVNTSLMAKIKGQESGSSFILIDPSGERIIFAQRGANVQLSLGPKQLAAVKKSRNVYIASLAGAWTANLRRTFAAASSGQNIFWNPGMTQLKGGLKALSPFLKRTSVLSLNKDEATELIVNSSFKKGLSRSFLDKTENLLRLIKEAGPQIVVVTLGPAGVMVYDGQQFYFRNAIKDKRRVDSTGVGDIFNSTFAAGFNLFSGDIKKSLDLARRNAAAKVAHLGAHNGLLKSVKRPRSRSSSSRRTK